MVVRKYFGTDSITSNVTTTNITLTSGNVTNVYGGGYGGSYDSNVTTANINVNGITIEEIHGGGYNQRNNNKF